jgi:hypothetical protein
MDLPAMWQGAHANPEAAPAEDGLRERAMNKPRVIDYQVGDEISYAQPSGMLYGEVKRVIGAGESGAIEIEFEDGRKEIKKVKDHSLRLLRRASGKSEAEESASERSKLRDYDIEAVRRSDQRKRW